MYRQLPFRGCGRARTDRCSSARRFWRRGRRPLLRVPIATDPTGLARPSYAMLDRITTAPRDKIGAVIGHPDEVTMLTVTRALAVFLSIA
jgi:mRNA-degrading endonuclease toxin of MazEF toxin-antitoxin module